MTFKDRIKIVKRAIARKGMYGVIGILRKVSYEVMRTITNIIMPIGFLFVIRHKKVAHESLTIAFGEEKTEEERNRIFKKCFEHAGKGMMELMYYLTHPDKDFRGVRFEGKEILDEAMRQGKGAIVVTAHFGNFPLMLLKCVREGYKTNAIIRPTRDKEVERYFQELRTGMGLKTVYSHPRKQCVDTSIKVLRTNEILCIPLDQHFGSGGGVYVDFFGRKAATATGPVIFAMRTKAPIIPMFIVRDENDGHRIIVEPPLDFEERETDQETILVNTSKITKVIEKYIRKYPYEWGWMHRRWKS